MGKWVIQICECVQVVSDENLLLVLFAYICLPSVPRLLFDGWSYQDYMSVLASEDEIEELGSELVDVAKVKNWFV